MAEAITIARPYATAVFRLAKEKKALAKWSEELAFIGAVSDNAQVKALIDDPKLPSSELERALLAIFDGKLSDTAINLVKLLLEHNHQVLIKPLEWAM
jgi:F-type H+-transporting ATPase subunit delta